MWPNTPVRVVVVVNEYFSYTIVQFITLELIFYYLLLLLFSFE